MENCKRSWFDDKTFQIFVNRHPKLSVVDTEKAKRDIHEEIEIKYYIEGTTTLLIGEKYITAEPGDIVVINPYEVHATIGYNGDTGSKYHLIMISQDFFLGMGPDAPDLRRFLSRGAHFETLFQNDERLTYIIEHIIAEFTEEKDGYRYIIRGLLLELFALLLRTGIQSKEVSASQEKAIRHFNLVAPALSKIRKEYAKKLSLEDLANLCGVSQCYFCRIFKQVTGVTALQYIIAYRLKIADAMLTNSDMSITEVANACGFEDASYFGRCYKKHFHHRPGKKRKLPSA